MDVSAYSLVAMCREANAAGLLHAGTSVLTLSYYGAEKVVANYNVMGVAKAALEACVRYLAADLGPSGVRVNAISAGPVRTLSASGVRDFRKLYGTFQALAPLRSNITIEDVGKTALWLASDLSSAVTGEVVYVDGGFNVMGVPLEGSRHRHRGVASSCSRGGPQRTDAGPKLKAGRAAAPSGAGAMRSRTCAQSADARGARSPAAS